MPRQILRPRGSPLKSAYLLGSPVAHSRSPQLHQAAYAQLGEPWQFEKREVKPEQLASVLEELAGPELLGINLTLPLKETAFSYCSPTPEARAIGAINCLRWSDRGWEGHNSDGQGWLDSFHEELGATLQGRKLLVLGAGGACRAVLHKVRGQHPSEIVLFNRTPERARALAQGVERVAAWSDLARELEPGCVVVQTTSVGMWPYQEEVPLAWPEQLPSGLIACDLIYNPSPTLWLRQAAERGARTLDGCGMLVHQAVRAIEWWTGRKPESGPMLAALRESLR
ncbi:MAG: shikimate dehydrogenase [Candidatus Eremiobacteraeota bacterium]|nr:shikimate dehydrogenase [Candidatus Eremiobacteraeota bacterium]MCW5872732.1 shikimate dehydrogenase [Candidatus Eremiobacteraeota bacterium]